MDSWISYRWMFRYALKYSCKNLHSIQVSWPTGWVLGLHALDHSQIWRRIRVPNWLHHIECVTPLYECRIKSTSIAIGHNRKILLYVFWVDRLDERTLTRRLGNFCGSCAAQSLRQPLSAGHPFQQHSASATAVLQDARKWLNHLSPRYLLLDGSRLCGKRWKVQWKPIFFRWAVKFCVWKMAT